MTIQAVDPIVFVFGGRSGVGKTTFCEYLAKESGVHHYALADRLKEDVSKKTGVPLEYFYKVHLKDTPMKEYGGAVPRELLIEHAKTVREKDPLYFAKILGEQIKPGHVSVISDIGDVVELCYFVETFNAVSVWIERDVPHRNDNRSLTKSDCQIVIHGDPNGFNPTDMIRQFEELVKDFYFWCTEYP